jgi:hypothetical protein
MTGGKERKGKERRKDKREKTGKETSVGVFLTGRGKKRSGVVREQTDVPLQ